MLDLQILQTPALILVTFCSAFILVSRNWRWSLYVLGLQYIGVFVLISSAWPVLMALTKLVAGWIAGALLSAVIQEIPPDRDARDSLKQILHLANIKLNMIHLSGGMFGLLAAGMVALVVISITPVASLWVPGITPDLAAGGMLLIGLGALHLGMTAQPFRVVLGLLTALSGFEIIYAAVESSLLVAGLLSGVTLGLALVGSYIVYAPYLKS